MRGSGLGEGFRFVPAGSSCGLVQGGGHAEHRFCWHLTAAQRPLAGDTSDSSPGHLAPEPSPPCSAPPTGPLVTAQVLAGPFCSEVGASSHPSSRTPQWDKIHPNSSQISPKSRAPLSRGAAMGVAVQGLGWAVTTHSSGVPKHPRVQITTHPSLGKKLG